MCFLNKRVKVVSITYTESEKADSIETESGSNASKVQGKKHGWHLGTCTAGMAGIRISSIAHQNEYSYP